MILRFNFLNLPRVFPQKQAEATEEDPGNLKKQHLVQYLSGLMLNLILLITGFKHSRYKSKHVAQLGERSGYRIP